ncbi:hypothetical protein BKA69DRAFT_480262, partial [Paraphysoderma sedebokerense]
TKTVAQHARPDRYIHQRYRYKQVSDTPAPHSTLTHIPSPPCIPVCCSQNANSEPDIKLQYLTSRLECRTPTAHINTPLSLPIPITQYHSSTNTMSSHFLPISFLPPPSNPEGIPQMQSHAPSFSSSSKLPTLKLASSSLCTIPYILGLPGITRLNVAAVIEMDIPRGFDIDRILKVRACFNGSSRVAFLGKQNATVIDTKPFAKSAKIIWNRKHLNTAENNSSSRARTLGAARPVRTLHDSTLATEPDLSSPESSPDLSNQSNPRQNQQPLQYGTNKLYFTFPIPHNLPPSIRETTANIIYTLTVYVHIAASGQSLFGSTKRKIIHATQEIVLPKWDLQNYINGYQALGISLSNRAIKEDEVECDSPRLLHSNFHNDESASTESTYPLTCMESLAYQPVSSPTSGEFPSSPSTLRSQRRFSFSSSISPSPVSQPFLPAPPPLTYDLNLQTPTLHPGRALSFHLTLTTPFPDMIVDVLHVGLKKYTDTLTMGMEDRECEYVCRWKVRGLNQFWKAVDASTLSDEFGQNESSVSFEDVEMTDSDPDRIVSTAQPININRNSDAPPSYASILPSPSSFNQDVSPIVAANNNRTYVLSQTFHFPLPEQLTPSAQYLLHQDSSFKISYKLKLSLSSCNQSTPTRSEFSPVSINPPIPRSPVISSSPPSTVSNNSYFPNTNTSNTSHGLHSPPPSPTSETYPSSLSLGTSPPSEPESEPQTFFSKARRRLSLLPIQLPHLNFSSISSMFKSSFAKTTRIQTEVKVTCGPVEGMTASVDDLVRRCTEGNGFFSGDTVTASSGDSPPAIDGNDESTDLDGSNRAGVPATGYHEYREMIGLDDQEELDRWWN